MEILLVEPKDLPVGTCFKNPSTKGLWFHIGEGKCLNVKILDKRLQLSTFTPKGLQFLNDSDSLTSNLDHKEKSKIDPFKIPF